MQPSSRLTHQSTRRAIPTLRSITKPTTTPTRTMSLFTTRPHSSSLSPTSPFTGFSLPSEFDPMFKLMDDYASHVARRSPSSTTTTTNNSTNDFWSLKTFTPKFDVKEEKDRYVLEGELPGIEQKDVSIEFTGEGNGQTLVVRGRTERVREEGVRPAGLIEDGEQQGQGQIEEGNGGGYHKPSVQDEEGDAQMSGGNPDAEQQSGEVAKQQQQQEKKEHPTSKYWISERSVGEFSRSFAFPARVDQENVRASLKNGVLSIVVPKAAQRGVKRIAIE